MTPTRRHVVKGALAGMAGAPLAACSTTTRTTPSPHGAPARRATWTVATGPPRQLGVVDAPGSHGHWVAFDLAEEADADALRRALAVLDDAASRLSTGRLPVTDASEELASGREQVSVLIGLGPRLFDLPGMRASRPAWLAPIPHMAIDRFEEPWSQSDLIVQIDADNPVTVSHAASQVIAALKGLARPRWQQRGFRAGSRPSDRGVTRNLFGQLDGQVNPTGTGREADVVWNSASAARPWAGSTTGLVIRRIRMDVTTWDSLDRQARENAVGRRLSNGAPLSGHLPDDPVDMSVTDANGLSIIDPASHVPRAMPGRTGERILRRPFNYEEPRADGTSDQGLVFVAFCADVAKQFVPIQCRLAEADILNTWTTPIGSSVYLVPAAPRPGRFLGQDILEATA